jgi:hypothetical protein
VTCLILDVGGYSGPTIIVVLFRDVGVDLLSKFGARNSDVRESSTVVNQENGEVHHMVGHRHVVIIVENVEDQHSQPLPFLDRKEPASTVRDVKSRACLPHDLIVYVGIQG